MRLLQLMQLLKMRETFVRCFCRRRDGGKVGTGVTRARDSNLGHRKRLWRTLVDVTKNACTNAQLILKTSSNWFIDVTEGSDFVERMFGSALSYFLSRTLFLALVIQKTTHWILMFIFQDFRCSWLSNYSTCQLTSFYNVKRSMIKMAGGWHRWFLESQSKILSSRLLRCSTARGVLSHSITGVVPLRWRLLGIFYSLKVLL